MNDAASLQNLNDIVVAAPVAWWPLAPGWYVVATIVFVLLVWQAVRRWQRWNQDRYRREALLALSSIRDGNAGSSLRDVPVLLKRAALNAWPRERVAALSGSDWHRFLDETAAMEQFSTGTGRLLDHLAYAGSRAQMPADAEAVEVISAAEFWLKHHRRPESGG